MPRRKSSTGHFHGHFIVIPGDADIISQATPVYSTPHPKPGIPVADPMGTMRASGSPSGRYWPSQSQCLWLPTAKNGRSPKRRILIWLKFVDFRAELFHMLAGGVPAIHSPARNRATHTRYIQRLGLLHDSGQKFVANGIDNIHSKTMLYHFSVTHRFKKFSFSEFPEMSRYLWRANVQPSG
jgi:hypothetical protein